MKKAYIPLITIFLMIQTGFPAKAVDNRIIGAYEGIILELENPEAAHDIIR